MHIPNLYSNQDILLFKEAYALEKIHGTSAAVYLSHTEVNLHSGGEKGVRFAKLFDTKSLLEKFNKKFMQGDRIKLHGEAYGGSQQGMRLTYGEELKFVVFDVKIGDCWLSVPQAEDIAKYFGLEFVDYAKISTNLKSIDAERDKDSTQAIRNGMGTGKMREGVVLRPLIELTKNNGERIISKHKRDEFKETATKREVSPKQLKIIEEAGAIAEEWVTSERFRHVLDKVECEIDITNTREIIKAMVEDVYREGKGEIIESIAASKAIGKATVILFKKYLNEKMRDKK